MEQDRTTDHECVFCGKTEGLTSDHIPPDNLFPTPRPSNLITVPSCLDCNRGSSKDDTYFRDCLLLWDITYDHPQAQKVVPAVLRSFGRPAQRAYSRSIFASMRQIDRVSPGGVYLGKKTGIKVDLLRLGRTASKIVKGLFYHEWGMRLPDTCAAHATCLVNELLAKDSEMGQWIRETCNSLMRTTRTTIGDDVFSFWHHRLEGDASASVWLLIFYKKVTVLGITGPKEMIPIL